MLDFTGDKPSLMTQLRLLLLIAITALLPLMGWGQTSVQNFGIASASAYTGNGSTTYIPNPTSGTTYVRAGGGGSPSIALSITNNIVGTGAYLRASASSSTSVSKVTPIASYTTATKIFYTKYSVLFGSSSGANGITSGTWQFIQGSGTNYTDNNQIQTAQVFAGLQFEFSNANVNLKTLSGSSWSSSSITAITQGQAHIVEIYGNNEASGTQAYTYGGNSVTVAAGKYDVYIDGALVADEVSKGGLTSNTTINALSFIGLSSTSNAANIFLDDVSVDNSFASPCTPPANPNGTISGTTPACTSTTLTYTAGTGQPESGVNYYWQTSAGGTSTANNAASTLNVTTSGTYYVRAYNGTCWSSGATAGYAVTVNAPPAITVQPDATDLSTCSGTNFSPAAVSVTATGTGLTYQWYSNTTAGTTGGTPINGATTASYTIPTNIPGTLYYYVVVSGNAPCAAATSTVSGARTVNPVPDNPNGTISGTTPACASTTLTYTAGAGQPQSNGLYYWQTSNTGTATTNDANAPLNVTASGTYYVRAFNGLCWSPGTSASSTVTINNNPVITTQPSNTSVGAGSTATFTVVANNAGSYQWQVNSGSGFVNLTNNAQYSGVNTTTLTVSNTTLFMDYYQYRVVVKAAAPCTVDVNSNAATLNVTPVSNATDYFRSRTTGLYGTASTWESSADSVSWMNATLAPTNVARSVTIRATDSVTVATSGRSAAHLYVFGKLTLNEQDLTIADSSGYDVVIFNGGRLDCGTLNAGSELTLATGATVLIKTGGRIVVRVSNALAGPGRGTGYFYEDRAVLEYAGTQAFTNTGVTYFPNNLPSAAPIFLISQFQNNIGGSTGTTTFNCIVEHGPGSSMTWTGTSEKYIRDGLIINGTLGINKNTPIVITGSNAVLEGAGSITLATGSGSTYPGGLSIAAGANLKLFSDFTISGGNDTLIVSGTLNTNGHKISGTAKFATAAGSTLIVTDAAGLTGSGTSGNIQTTGTRTFSTSGNYIYRGTAAQATGDGLTGSATLEIDNAAGVTLSAAHTATTGLTLTSGNLTTTTTNLLTLGSAAVLTGGSATAFVAGPLKRATAAATDFLFPIGKPGDYAPVTITPQTATASDYTAEYFNGAQLTPNRGNKAASLKYVAANEYFDISRGTGADAKVTLTYTTAAQVTDPSTLVVAHYTGGQWVSEGGTATGNNNSGTVISGNFVSSFSPFALGSTSAAQPLPLQLLSFSARPAARAALLDWELATPDGGEQIVVERSNDGSDFTALGRFDLTKETPLRQRFTDESPLTGPNYYRLRITGVDGVVTHSPVRTLHFGAVATSDLRLYPNPAHDVLNLEWTRAEAPAHIQLFTSAGRLVLSEKVLNKANASLSVSGLVPGVYWVVWEQAGKTERRQVQIDH